MMIGDLDGKQRGKHAIIAGSRRGAKLTKLDTANTRPTARCRVTLIFLMAAVCRLDGAVVIGFAGTGAPGLEASVTRCSISLFY